MISLSLSFLISEIQTSVNSERWPLNRTDVSIRMGAKGRVVGTALAKVG